MRGAKSDDVVVQLPAETDRDRVLAIHGKVVTHRKPATRTEGQVFAHGTILVEQSRRFVCLCQRPDRRDAERQAAEPSGGRQVAIEQRRRDREHVCDIVEAVLVGVVNREDGVDIDVEAEHIAHGVPILRTIQPVNAARAAGVRVAVRRAIQLVLEPRDERAYRGRVRLATARGRHRSHPQLLQHFLQTSARNATSAISGVSNASPAVRSFAL